jgi:hypothetical protein
MRLRFGQRSARWPRRLTRRPRSTLKTVRRQTSDIGLSMPRYFFNTRIGDDLIPDVEGEELRDADHAWEVARAMIVELLADQGEQATLLTASLVVTDESGEIVLDFPFAEALIGTPEHSPTRH